MPAADLTFRKDLSVALTSTQVDGNFEVLRDFSNGLEALYNTSFNQDGTLKNSLTATSLKADAVYYATDSGTTDDYAITLTPAITEYTDGLVVSFKANTTNEDAASLNVNSVGAKPLNKRKDVALETGDILAGQIVEARYDSTLSAFQVISQLGNQVGLPVGSEGQLLRVSADNKLEFYTPTIAEAEFYPHATPYWFVAYKNEAYGTDADDASVTVTVSDGTTETWAEQDSLFLDLGTNLTDETFPVYNTFSNNHKYVDLVFDNTKLTNAGGGDDVAKISGLMLNVQLRQYDSRIGGVSMYNTSTDKYVPLWSHETGDQSGTAKGVMTSTVTAPRIESDQYRFRVFFTSDTTGSPMIGFKVMGHY